MSVAGEVQDLATLSKLDDAILLRELEARYTKDAIYVGS
jgi:myosin heavy subunit